MLIKTEDNFFKEETENHMRTLTKPNVIRVNEIVTSLLTPYLGKNDKCFNVLVIIQQ